LDKTYGSTWNDYLRAVLILPDGDLLLCGLLMVGEQYAPNRDEEVLIKIDENGNERVDFLRTKPGSDRFRGVAISSDRNLLFVGGIGGPWEDITGVYLTKADLSGKVIWEKPIRRDNRTAAKSILSTPDADIVIGGTFLSEYSGRDFWILRLR